MKRCSTCNRTYTDPNLSFCIDDGTPLTTVASDGDETVVRPRDKEGDDSNAAAYQPPGSYVPPGTDIKRSRHAWPWVVGILGAFILGILVIAIAGAILVPRIIRSSRNGQPRVSIKTGENSNSNAESNTNSNTSSTEHVETPPPADREQVLAQLRDLEQEWTVANLNADKKKLDRILADDYAGQSADGGLESKAQYIRTIERDTDVEKWEFNDLKLILAGDRATLSGNITYFLRDRTVTFDFTDRFVWRDGRWQATGAELKRRGSSETDL
jgi:uncharacterized protein DUF4440